MTHKWLIAAICSISICAGCTSKIEKEIIADFNNPPQEAKPVMIWQWMDGWVSKEGITHDLEAYAAAGVAGVQNFQVGGRTQTGFTYEKNPIGSPEWKELMRHAMEECARLGLTFGTHNCPGWSSSAYPSVTPEYSMLELVWTSTYMKATDKDVVLAQPQSRLDFYRDICVLAIPAGEKALSTDMILDISGTMKADGTISWDTQGREWEVLRFGYTSLNKRDNSTSPISGAGLECDKMSREAVKRFWDGYPSMILDIAGDLAGKTLVNFEIDSYEQKSQSWTPKMEEEFASHRGYALRPWLAVLAGKQIESEEKSEQFRKDWQATIEDLFAENYYGYMAELVEQTPGMRLLIQPYGEPLNSEKVVAQDDDFILCGEFWTKPATWGGRSIYQVSELGRKYGHEVIYAEGFTCWPLNAWENDPFTLKVVADKVFCVGINRLMMHAAAANPWPWAKPGMTFGKWGTQFTPGDTFWEAGGSKAFFNYLAKCQALLQRGTFVANQTEGEIHWIHRRDKDVDIYFVSNQNTEKAVEIDLPFVENLALAAGGSEFIVMRDGQRLPISLNEGLPCPTETVEAEYSLNGEWTVKFQENRGAPEQAVFAELSDWKDNSEAGIRHFSGTASYHKNVELELPKDGSRLYIDLGEVMNMAEVLVNGQSCGILWRKPFVADITDAVKDGANEIEIKVTNSWANRLIGDEYEPDDIVWDTPARYSYAPGNPFIGSTIREVPEWLEKNLPRPSAGRYAIVSYKPFSKDAPLRPSGLIGPVKIGRATEGGGA